jgi:small conductance mechanosensitive channel
MLHIFEEKTWNSNFPYIITFIVIIVLTIILGRITSILLNKFFERSSLLLRVDLSKYNIVKHLIVSTIHIVGVGLAIYSVPSLRSLSLSIFAGAGILAAIIGFASQKAFSNIISGIFIAIFKPFRMSDRIQVGVYSGIVEDITLRHTVIRNFENKRIVIPNSVISDDTVINLTIIDEKICKVLDLRISYSSDIKRIKEIIREEAKKNPKYIDNRNIEQLEAKEDPVRVRVMGWSESAIDIRVWVWARTPSDAFELGCDLYETIKYRFDDEGIEFPFPHRVMVSKNEG